MVAYEILHSFRNKRVEKFKSIAIKLDNVHGTKVFESEAVPVLSDSKSQDVVAENVQDVLSTEGDQEGNVSDLNLNDTQTYEKYTDTVAPCCAPDNSSCEEQVESAGVVAAETGCWNSFSQEHGLEHRDGLVEE
ncbi:hypothetical protein V6N11_066279 [Hibiscus sabdariffa]|uniref:Uncharacterized protein n=1 Tax=Hibiscus sabdariffa TaxID=183260 RepID=A0ABR1ZED5_9ROSI